MGSGPSRIQSNTRSPRPTSPGNHGQVSGSKRTESKQSSKILVVAIDIGTTYSGYAFSFKHEYSQTPPVINTNQWTGTAGVNLKTPSCLLLHPDRKLHSFGTEAKDKYETLAQMNDHKEWYFFWKFKMTLHQEQDITDNYKLIEENGKELDALTVFSLCIEFLKIHFLKQIHESSSGIKQEEITWVITVPAIWKDSAKKFMRKAAEKAGISKERIELALEPEAASLYCRQLPVARDPQTVTGMTIFGAGTKYMILDCGGGTVDVTVHEVMNDFKLREIHAATGGYWGGTRVNKAFWKFIEDLVGADVFSEFSTANKSDYLEMLDDFEKKKRSTTPESNDLFSIRIPVSLHDLFSRTKKREMSEEISQSNRSAYSIVGDKLRISADAFRIFFKEAIREIVNHVSELLECIPGPIKAILMVGGFSDSPVLKKAVKDRFSDEMEVIIPVDASLCVMKGAVLYGHDQTVVSSRKCPFTYGVAMTVPFKENIHPIHKKLVIKGEELCDDIFDKHVEVGQTVITGEAQGEQTYFPLSIQDRILPVILYRSPQREVMFIDDQNCHFAGKFLVHITYGVGTKIMSRPLKVRMIFGGSDIVIEATENNGKVHSAEFSIDGS